MTTQRRRATTRQVRPIQQEVAALDPRTDTFQAIKPADTGSVKVAGTEVEALVEQLLKAAKDEEDGPKFETNELTADMVLKLLVAQVGNSPSFHRTDAGFVSMTAGVDRNGESYLKLVHWTSFNFPEDDRAYEVTVRLGTLVPVRMAETPPNTIEGEVVPVSLTK